LGIVIDEFRGPTTNIPMISFNIDALNNENWPIWIGETVAQLPSSTPSHRSRVRNRPPNTLDEELPPRTRATGSRRALPINVTVFDVLYMCLV